MSEDVSNRVIDLVLYRILLQYNASEEWKIKILVGK